jgi:hypothetical protein
MAHVLYVQTQLVLVCGGLPPFIQKKGNYLALLLYLPRGYKFITRDPNRPSARIRGGPFDCGSEHHPLNSGVFRICRICKLFPIQ